MDYQEKKIAGPAPPAPGRVLRDLSRGEKPATAAEMRGIIIDHVRQVVLAHERKLAREQAEAGVTEITPT